MDERGKMDAIREKLAAHRDELARMRVRSLKVFGSRARGEARHDSDLDMIAEFYEAVGFFELQDVERYLGRLLDCKIDLTTPGSLHPALRARILSDAIQVV